MSMNFKNGSGPRVAVLLAALDMLARASAVFLIVVSVLVIANAAQSRRATPLEAPELAALRLALYAQPDDAALQQRIRAMDLLARRAYFSGIDFAAGSVWLLLGGAVVFLAAARSAAALRAKVVDPRAADAGPAKGRPEHHRAQTVLGLVGGLALALVLTVSLRVRPFDYERAGDPASGPAKAGPESMRDAVVTPAAISAEASGDAAWDEAARHNWPAFRGPGGNAIATSTNPPRAWNAASGDGVLWRSEVPLPGFSSPVVWGGHVFLTGADAARREVYAFDARSGTLRWTHQVASPADLEVPEVSADTGYAASTAATDGKHVFAIFATGDLVAIDYGGKRLWGVNLGVPDNPYGHSSSLLIWRHLLIVQFDHRAEARLIAFDAASGREVWSRDRATIAWGSPICVRTGARDALIVTCSSGVDAYDPLTGEPLWSVACLDAEVGTSAAHADGLVVVANEFSVASGLRLGEAGASPGVAWEFAEDLPDIASPLATTHGVYLATSGGVVTCLDPATGSVNWRHEYDHGFCASPVLAAGQVYALDKTGVMHTFADATTYVALTNSPLGERTVCTPAFVGNRLYLRGERHLFCIGGEP